MPEENALEQNFLEFLRFVPADFHSTHVLHTQLSAGAATALIGGGGGGGHITIFSTIILGI
jgi:hypothetical protein